MTNPAEKPRLEAVGQGADTDAIRRRLDALIEMERAVGRRPDLNFLKKKLDEWGFGSLSEQDRAGIESDYGEHLSGVKEQAATEAVPQSEAAEQAVGGGRRETERKKPEKKLNREFLGYSVERDADGGLVVYERFQTLDKRKGRYRERPPAATAIKIPAELASRMSSDPKLSEDVMRWMEERRRDLGPENAGGERLRLFPDPVVNAKTEEVIFEPRWKYGFTDENGRRQRAPNRGGLSIGTAKWSEADRSQPVENPDEMPWDILDMIQKYEYGEMIRRGRAPAWEKRSYKEYVAEMKQDGFDATVPYWKDPGYNSWIGKAAQRKREGIISSELESGDVERRIARQNRTDEGAPPTPATERVPADEPKKVRGLLEAHREPTEESAPVEEAAPPEGQGEDETERRLDHIRRWVGHIAEPKPEDERVAAPEEAEPGEIAAEAPVEAVAAKAEPPKAEAEPISVETVIEEAKPLLSQQIEALKRLYKLPEEKADLAEWSAKVVRATLADRHRRQGDKDLAVRLLKDDSIVEALTSEAVTQIDRPSEDEALGRKAEQMLAKARGSEAPRELTAEQKKENLRQSLAIEIGSSLSEMSEVDGFEAVAARLVDLTEGVLSVKGTTDCAKMDEDGRLKVTDREKFDLTMRRTFERLAKK